MHLARGSRGVSSAKSSSDREGDMRDWMAFATAIVLALLTKILLP
jgi:hypothetical protein